MIDSERSPKAVIYVRVSSSTQTEEYWWNGLKSQETACREFARLKWIEVVSVFSDWWVSWKYMSREALDSMIAYLKLQNKSYTKINFVIVDDIDRVSRDILWWWSIKTNIESSWATLLSLKQNLDSSPEWVLNQNIIMSFKQFERENNARRVRDRQRSRMLEWHWPLYPPPGYKHFTWEDKKKLLRLQEPDASMIKDALELFASGMFPTKEEFRKYLLEQWLRSRKAKKIFRSFTDRLLEEPRLRFYAWYIDYEPRDIRMVKAKHPALIEENIVYRIIERLNPKTLYTKYSYTDIDEKMHLRSVVLCEACWHPFTGWPSKSHTWKHYFYYSCRQKWCANYGKSISAEKLHLDFETFLSTLKIESVVLDLLKWSADEFYTTQTDSIKQHDTNKKQEIKSIDKLIEQMQDRILWATDVKVIALYEKRLREYIDKKNVFESDLKSWGQTTHYNLWELIENSKEMLVDPLNVWQDSDIENKRLLVKVLFNDNLTYWKISGIWTSEIPLLYRDFSLLWCVNSFDLEMMGIEPMSKRHKQ